MRVSSNGFPNNLAVQLNQLMARQNRLQDQVASGQKVTLPEDNPGAVQRVLDLQTQSLATNQYQANISRVQEMATTTYTAVQGLKTISDRAGEIATLADGLSSPDELASYATEVGNLIQQAVQVANSKDRGSYIFSGTKSDTPPFAVTTDSNGNVTGVTYQGNTSVPQTEVAPDVTLSVQVPGANTTGTGARGLITDDRSGADFLNHLISLQNNLLAGNTDAIASTDRVNLGKDEENILYHVADNGAMQSRLSASSSSASQYGLSLNTQISNEADADIAQTLIDLSRSQTAYQAALQSGAMLMNNSLLNYLE
jgi:flagellar hook-associated protein 3 FlgL